MLAIKETIYRTSDDSPLIPALIRATERGKQAVGLVELKARFDERVNIHWASSIEEAGVHVVYGHPALKTHAKCILVVRREGDGVRHYVHIGTGNYHPATARIYTDFGLFTCDAAIGADVSDMFNFLTGYARPLRSRRVWWRPSTARRHDRADRGDGRRARGLARAHRDEDELARRRALHPRAVRRLTGRRARRPERARICCLRPGVPGISENIRVVSIVGRLLEHSRVFAFERGGEHTVYIASADLMPRNLDHRVELAAPIESPEIRAELLDTLRRGFADNQSSWELDGDGAGTAGAGARRDRRATSSCELAELHAARARRAAGG